MEFLRKNKETEKSKVMDHKFRITDIIDKAKKKVVNKYAKFQRLHMGDSVSKTNRNSPRQSKTRKGIDGKKLNYSEARNSAEISIKSGLNKTVQDPYWKKDLRSPYKASINKSFLLQSSQDNTSEPSNEKDRNLKSTIHLPFELKFNNETNKLYAIPTPRKHLCGNNHNRSLSVVTSPKNQSKFLKMEYYLPRDYKIFDVNMSISPLYSEREDRCDECIKSLPKL